AASAHGSNSIKSSSVSKAVEQQSSSSQTPLCRLTTEKLTRMGWREEKGMERRMGWREEDRMEIGERRMGWRDEDRMERGERRMGWRGGWDGESRMEIGERRMGWRHEDGMERGRRDGDRKKGRR
ncbi:unnamed protein product, partial [Pleuronectes platessa]